MKIIRLIGLLCLFPACLAAQNGNEVFRFLRFPTSVRAGALGGHTVSLVEADPALVFHNPALLGGEMNGMVGVGYMNYISGIHVGNAIYAMRGIACGAILNVALDPLFIFVFRMGIAGAAVATVVLGCSRPTACLQGNLRLGQEHLYAGEAGAMLTLYGVLPDPWQAPHRRLPWKPMSDQGPGFASLRPAVADDESGAAASMRSTVHSSGMTPEDSGRLDHVMNPHLP